MKKNLLLITLLIIIVTVQAQAPLNYQTSSKYENRQVGDAKTTTKGDIAKPVVDAGDRSLTYYLLNYSDAVDYALNGWTLANLAVLPLWPDSTTYVVTGTGEDFYWYGHAYAHMFDPLSDYVTDFVDENYTVIGDASDWFNNDHGFKIDSVRFYYYYDRFNTNYTDTLKVYIMGPNSTVYQEGYFLDNDANGDYDEGIDISLFLAKYNYMTNQPNGTVTEYTFLLDDDDTASFNLASISIDIDLSIIKNLPDHNVGIAWEYIPGQPYSVGDTLLDFSDPPSL